MLSIEQLRIPVTQTISLKEAAAVLLKLEPDRISRMEVIRRSLDARGDEPQYVYVLNVSLKDETQFLKKKHLPRGVHVTHPPKPFTVPRIVSLPPGDEPPVVVGMGPAGLFCALTLARAGFHPLVIERGEPVEDRSETVDRFFRDGVLDPSSNVQFGEGGAGTYSDGKLSTGVKDREGHIRVILKDMVDAGAPPEILYENKPHIGTDKLKVMVRGLREQIIASGGNVRFRTAMTDFETTDGRISAILTDKGERIQTRAVFLGVGHSARDTFTMLYGKGLRLEQKAFAVGVRIEHLQVKINEARYHAFADPKYGLGAADYKVTHTASNGRGVYSFCMCPGGLVVPAASEEGRLAVNGMSLYARNGINANSALIVTVGPDDFKPFARYEGDVLAGMRFQRDLEEKAFQAGGGDYRAPVQTVGGFLHHEIREPGQVEPSCLRGYTLCDLNSILPPFVSLALGEGLQAFDRRIDGFACADAVLSGVESRTSSPVRIVRDPKTMTSSTRGLYPIGEGAGYAGGIMSAAMDGMKAALHYIDLFKGEG